MASSVVVAVPAADPVLTELRARFGVAGSVGVPAHVSVLHPFVPPQEVDDEAVARLAAAVAAVPAFELTLADVAWFGDEVLWLRPVPAAPLRDLTVAVCAAFPGYLPYGGLYPSTQPHLTVGKRDSFVDLAAAAEAVRALLPLTTGVRAVELVCDGATPGSWHTVATLPLHSTQQSRTRAPE